MYDKCENVNVALASATIYGITDEIQEKFENIKFTECIFNPE